MQVKEVTFFSQGCKLVGTIKKPDDAREPLPVLVEGPGWMALSKNALSDLFHEGLVAGGYAVFTFDWRGVGPSEGEPGWARPEDQVQDLLNALTFVETRPDLDADRLGLFGFGGTGGGNAIYVAAMDDRPKAICAMTVVADGEDWLHRMRREHEWVAYLKRLKENRRRLVLENQEEMIEPREEIMVATPERKAAGMPTGDVKYHLSSAESIMRWRPLDVVDRVAPAALLLTCVENDAVTPEDHARALYERAKPPKKLIRQTGVSHYESYRKNYDLLMAQFLDWYGRYLVPGRTVARAQYPIEEIVTL